MAESRQAARLTHVHISAHNYWMIVETYTSSRNNLKALMDRVVAGRAPVKITRQKAEGVVMVSESDWESIEETLYLLSSPRNAARLLEAVRGFDEGKGEPRELIEA